MSVNRCIWNFRGQMLRYTMRLRPFACASSGIPGRARACSLWFWRPTLYRLSYGNIKSRPWNRTSRVYTHAPRSKLRSGGHIALKKPRVCGLGALLTHIRRARNGALRIPALLLWKNACDIEKKKPERRCCRWGDGSHASGGCGYSCPALRCDTVESNHNPISRVGRLPIFRRYRI